ncbi:hypothetical protein E2C01_047630 [Portunus trituberculatus]|uniref:Uncharacterized protein n=1 Tax=Portunus trituberculatus TaxID=210409 RepID=A0A5B7G1M5_PORTR|nr:hypothetical protein [Portunus trituberculatus]
MIASPEICNSLFDVVDVVEYHQCGGGGGGDGGGGGGGRGRTQHLTQGTQRKGRLVMAAAAAAVVLVVVVVVVVVVNVVKMFFSQPASQPATASLQSIPVLLMTCSSALAVF